MQFDLEKLIVEKERLHHEIESKERNISMLQPEI